MMLVKCHHCGNEMKYQPKGLVQDKSKRCVYCGKSFVVRTAILKEIKQ